MTNETAEPETKTAETEAETASWTTYWRERRSGRGTGGVVFALLLISFGLLFLLNNFNIVPWNVWETVWRFWPVLIIIWGLSLIFGRSRVGAIVTFLVSLVLIVLVLLIAVSATNDSFRQGLENGFPIWKNIEQIIPKPEEKTLDLKISADKYRDISERDVSAKIGSGSLTMTDSNSTDYFSLHSVYSSGGGKPVVKDSSHSGTLSIDFSTEASSGLFLGGFGSPKYEITLGQPSLLTAFDFNQGSGNSEINFNEVKVSSVSIDLGSGSMNLSFGLPSVPSKKSSINMGSGSIKIILPKTTALKVNYNMGSGNLTINSNSFSGKGVFSSDNFNEAASKFELDLKMGSGNVTIVNSQL